MEMAQDEPDTAHLSAAFDRRLKLGFHESRAMSYAGLPIPQEPNDAFGLTGVARQLTTGLRTGGDAGLQQIVEGYYWREGFGLACGVTPDQGTARRSCVHATALHC